MNFTGSIEHETALHTFTNRHDHKTLSTARWPNRFITMGVLCMRKT